MGSNKKRTDDQLSREAWLASFPEKNPNPILEISLDGQIEYTNPSIRKIFPTLTVEQTNHLFLSGWDEIVGMVRKQPDLLLNREVKVGGEVYHQSIHFVREYQRLRVYGVNITARKRSEALLKERNEALEKARLEAETEKRRLEAVMEALPVGMTITDDQGGVLQMNAAFEKVWGGKPPETQSVKDYGAYKAWWVDTGKEVAPEEWASAQSVQKGKTIVGQLMKIRRFDGGRAYIFNSASPVRDASKNIIGSAVVIQDITQLREAEQALEEANELLEQRVKERTVELTAAAQELQAAKDLLETVFESVDMMIAYMDRDFNFLRVNQAYAQADGHDPEYYVKKNHFMLFPNEENQTIFQKVVDTGVPYVVYEKPFTYEYDTERGVTYWDWCLQPVKGLDGVVQGLVLSLVNVTERVRADQQVHQGLQRGVIMAEFSNAVAQAGPDYQAVLDTITRKSAELLKGICAIRLVSSDGKYLELASLYHRDPDTQDVLYQMIGAYAQPVDEGFAGKVFQTGEKILIEELEFERIREEYSPDYAGYLQKLNINSAIAMPLRYHGEVSGVLIVYRCPPEKPLTEWELEIMQPAADRAALAINNARLYRDLQKSLQMEQNMRIQLIQAEKYAALARLVASVAHELNNPIQTIQNSLYLVQGNLPADDPNREFVQMAVSEGKRVSNLVAQLRETYRPARENIAKTFNLVDLLENFRGLILAHTQQNHVNLEVRYHAGCCLVNGIYDQIKQVFINIGLNAIEAMQPEGGNLTIDLRTLPEERWVQISFTNTGPSIDPKNISQLFEPFFSTKPKGTGLGLSICYEIIQAHGGKISVQSEPGQATAFIVSLPIHSPD